MDIDDSPWEDNDKNLQDAEWSKLSSDFVNVGYREGITAGKEGALQEGFDEGFAQTGAPIGRSLGLLRGYAFALVALAASNRPVTLPDGATRGQVQDEARTLSAELSRIRFSDIAPPDLQAEEHARAHREDVNADVVVAEELQEKRALESLEDMMNRMGAGPAQKAGRPTMEDVARLEAHLQALAQTLGLVLPRI